MPARMLAAALCTAAWPAAQCRLTASPGTARRPAVIGRVPRDDAAAVQALAEDHVVDLPYGSRPAAAAAPTT